MKAHHHFLIIDSRDREPVIKLYRFLMPSDNDLVWMPSDDRFSWLRPHLGDPSEDDINIMKRFQSSYERDAVEEDGTKALYWGTIAPDHYRAVWNWLGLENGCPRAPCLQEVKFGRDGAVSTEHFGGSDIYFYKICLEVMV